MLPDDAWGRVMLYVRSYRDLCTLSMVSAQLYSAATDDEVWEEVCRRKFSEEEFAAQRDEGWCRWKTAFAVKMQLAVEQKVVAFIRDTVSTQSWGGRVDPKPLANLIRLDLSKTCVGEEGARRLGLALKGNRSLECVNMANQQLKDISGIVDVLVTMPKLSNVNLSSNRLGAPGAENVRRLLHAKSSTLTRLTINDNYFSTEGITRLTPSLPTKRHPLQLSLDYNQITDQGLATLLPSCHHIRSLSIKDNGLTSASCPVIEKFLNKVGPGFKLLDLSNTLAHPNKKSQNKFKNGGRRVLTTLAEAKHITLILPTSEKQEKGCRCM